MGFKYKYFKDGGRENTPFDDHKDRLTSRCWSLVYKYIKTDGTNWTHRLIDYVHNLTRAQVYWCLSLDDVELEGILLADWCSIIVDQKDFYSRIPPRNTIRKRMQNAV